MKKIKRKKKNEKEKRKKTTKKVGATNMRSTFCPRK
jgi:hypothetical protein